MLVSLKRFGCRVVGKCDCVANLCLCNGFNGSGDIADLTGRQRIGRFPLRSEYAYLSNIEFLADMHKSNSVACAYSTFHYPNIAQGSLIVIIIAVENQCSERCVCVAFGRGKIGNYPSKNLLNIQSRFCGHLRRILCRNADDVLDLMYCALWIG